MYQVRLLVALLVLCFLVLTAGCGKQEQSNAKKEETKKTVSASVRDEAKEMDQKATTKSMDQWQTLREERQTQWDSMSEEEKQALREKRRLAWESLSEQEKQAIREARQAKFDAMSPEEQQALREKGIKMKSHE